VDRASADRLAPDKELELGPARKIILARSVTHPKKWDEGPAGTGQARVRSFRWTRGFGLLYFASGPVRLRFFGA